MVVFPLWLLSAKFPAIFQSKVGLGLFVSLLAATIAFIIRNFVDSLLNEFPAVISKRMFERCRFVERV